MKTVNNYTINPNTAVIMPDYDKDANLYSKVIDGNEPLIVKMSPYKIIEHSMLYYCSTLQGATIAARTVLGNIKMSPVVLCTQLDIYLFPSSSPRKNECIWFSHEHVKDTVQISTNKTNVHLTNRHTITMEINKLRFDKKHDRATKLRHILTERIKTPATYEEDDMSGLQICMDPSKNRYDIN